LRQGAIDGLSIGFRTNRARVEPGTRVRKLHALELWEISIVTFPLLAGARVRAVKHASAAPPTPKPRGRTRVDDNERLLRKYPRLSFARREAEREWGKMARGDGASW
jgi:phage head maturation protease